MTPVEPLQFGSYQVLQRPDGSHWSLGKGSYGTTYKAQHKMLKRICALKIIHERHMQDDREKSRFLQEAQIAASLLHPGIAQIFDFGIEAGLFFYAMEFCDGGSLADLLTREGPLPWSDVADIARQVGDALATAHGRGLLHRDIKPQNVMLARNARPLQAKLIDFGLVKILDHAETDSTWAVLSREGVFRGNYATASPEQLDQTELDERSDLFSFGVTLWWLLIGSNPFDGMSEARLIADRLGTESYAGRLQESFPPEARRIIAKLLEKNPANRYSSAVAFLADLARNDNSSSSPPVEIRSEPPPPPLPTAPAKRNAPSVFEDDFEIIAQDDSLTFGKTYRCVDAEGRFYTVLMPVKWTDSADMAAIRQWSAGGFETPAMRYFGEWISDENPMFLYSVLGNLRLLDLLKTRGPAPLAVLSKPLERLAISIDEVRNNCESGLVLDPHFIRCHPPDVSAANRVDPPAWAGFTEWSLATLPALRLDQRAETSASDTISASEGDFAPTIQFASLIYRLVSGIAVKHAALFVQSAYVPVSALSEEGNRFLSSSLLADDLGAYEFLERLLQFEGIRTDQTVSKSVGVFHSPVPATGGRRKAVEEERKHAEEARRQEESRQKEEARRAEDAQRQEEARLAEEARSAEEARRQEEARLAEERHRMEEQLRVEQARLQELARKAEDAKRAEEAWKQEELRRAEDARKLEEARKADEARRQEQARIAEETRRKDAERQAEDARLQELARKADEARQAEEARKREELRLAEEARHAAEARRAQDARKEEEPGKQDDPKKAAEAKKARKSEEAAQAASRKEESAAKLAEIQRQVAERKAEEVRIAAATPPPPIPPTLPQAKKGPEPSSSASAVPVTTGIATVTHTPPPLQPVSSPGGKKRAPVIVAAAAAVLLLLAGGVFAVVKHRSGNKPEPDNKPTQPVVEVKTNNSEKPPVPVVVVQAFANLQFASSIPEKDRTSLLVAFADANGTQLPVGTENRKWDGGQNLRIPLGDISKLHFPLTMKMECPGYEFVDLPRLSAESLKNDISVPEPLRVYSLGIKHVDLEIGSLPLDPGWLTIHDSNGTQVSFSPQPEGKMKVKTTGDAFPLTLTLAVPGYEPKETTANAKTIGDVSFGQCVRTMGRMRLALPAGEKQVDYDRFEIRFVNALPAERRYVKAPAAAISIRPEELENGGVERDMPTGSYQIMGMETWLPYNLQLRSAPLQVGKAASVQFILPKAYSGLYRGECALLNNGMIIQDGNRKPLLSGSREAFGPVLSGSDPDYAGWVEAMGVLMGMEFETFSISKYLIEVKLDMRAGGKRHSQITGYGLLNFSGKAKGASGSSVFGFQSESTREENTKALDKERACLDMPYVLDWATYELSPDKLKDLRGKIERGEPNKSLGMVPIDNKSQRLASYATVFTWKENNPAQLQLLDFVINPNIDVLKGKCAGNRTKEKKLMSYLEGGQGFRPILPGSLNKVAE